MKNPPCQSAWRVQKASGNSSSSLAVFYVEQVALNRHVSPQPRLLPLSLKMNEMSRPKGRVQNLGQHIGTLLRQMVCDMNVSSGWRNPQRATVPRPSDQ